MATGSNSTATPSNNTNSNNNNNNNSTSSSSSTSSTASSSSSTTYKIINQNPSITTTSGKLITSLLNSSSSNSNNLNDNNDNTTATTTNNNGPTLSMSSNNLKLTSSMSNSSSTNKQYETTATTTTTTNSSIEQNNQGLKIKTKSIEKTLLPLVTQITTLVNFKDNFKSLSSNSKNLSSSIYHSDRTLNALLRVGETVNIAIERFVIVGETIAYENPTIKTDMLEACSDAKEAGTIIRAHTQITNLSSSSNNSNSEKITMIQAANTLLNSVTKVLLLADVVIINQILNSKNKVLLTLNKLENVIDFWNFVNFFTQYGTDLIELAHLTGERQNDLKDDKKKSQLSSARWILEKSTSMILTSSKAYLKHLDCECAKENVSLVYSFLQNALDTLHYVIVDSGTMFDFSSSAYKQSMFQSSIIQISFVNAHHQFEDALDLSRNNMLNLENGNLYVLNALSTLIDSTQDFTDSLFINNDQRERILRLQNEIREKTLSYLKEEHRLKQEKEQDTDKSNTNSKAVDDTTGVPNQNESSTTTNTSNQQAQTSSQTNIRFARIFKTSPILNDCEVLKKLLQSQTMQLANCLFRENQDATLLNYIKTYSASNHYDLLIETLDKFRDYSDQVLELCKLLRHISMLEVFEVTCEHHYNVFENLSKMVQSAAGTAALYPSCKSATENLNLFCNSWENQINDLSILVKEMQDLMTGAKSNKSVYFSLPRPGKHGTNARLSSEKTANIKPSRLDSNEKAKIAKLGLEMKLITSEIEAEADKWNEPQNQIVKLAKSMSDMAYEIHLFTRGEGSLKTTQDLFVRADAFLQHGVLLYSIVKEFINQIPSGYLKEELVQLIEKLPINFKQLKNRLKQVTVGKTATFNKVDFVIQETRDFMNLVAKLVTSCFLATTKYNISYEQEAASVNISEFLDLNSIQPNFNLNQKNVYNKKMTNINSNKYGNQQFYNTSSSNNRSDSCGPELRSQLYYNNTTERS